MQSANLSPETAAAPAAVLGMPRDVAWSLTALVVLALVIRVPFLAHSVWFDEACMSDQRIGTWPQLLATLYVDIHPPLYVTFMHFWNGVFGDSELSMRTPPMLAGLLSIPLVYWAGHRLVGSNAALWAAVLLVLSPVHVWYSAEARLYAPMVACTLLAVGTFDRLLDPTQPRRSSLWWLHAGNVAVMLALHYYLAIYVVLLALLAPLLRGMSASALRLMLLHGAGILLLGAFVSAKIALGTFETSQDYLRAMNIVEVYRLLFDWCWTGHTLLAVDTALERLAGWSQQALGVVLVALGCVHVVKTSKEHRMVVLVPLCLLAIPGFLCITAATGHSQTYTERSALPALPFVFLLAGLGLVRIRPLALRRVVGTTVLLLSLGSLIALYAFHERHWTVYKPYPDWRSAAAYLSQEIDHGAAGRPIFTSTPNPRSLSYYDPRIQDVKNLAPATDAVKIGQSVESRLGQTLGDYAARTFGQFAEHNARLLAAAALRVYRSRSDPEALLQQAPLPDGICYLVRDEWHPHRSEDHTIEDLLVHPRIEVLESKAFVAVTVHKVRLKP